MSYFFGDGFDLYAAPADAANGHWDTGSAANLAMGTGRFLNGRAFVISGSGSFFVKSSGQNDAIHHLFCAYQQTQAFSGAGTLGLYFQLSDGVTNQCCVVFRIDGSILLTSGTPNGTVLATYSSAVPVLNTWYAFEFEVVINNTTGSFAVRRNGNTTNDFSATSLNTRPGTNNYANKLTFGVSSSIGSIVDDVLWRSDASSVPWAGDVRCYTRRPASDASVQWSQGGVTSGLTQIVSGGGNGSMNGSSSKYTWFICNYTGVITTISVATQVGSSPTGQIKAALFADNGNAPGAILSNPGVLPCTVGGTFAFTLPTPIAVSAGQRVWVGTSVNFSDAFGWSMNLSSTSGGSGATSFAAFPQANPVFGVGQGDGASITYGTTPGNYALVAEQQQDTSTTYVYSNTVGLSDFYTIDAITGTPASILGVITRAYMQKSDAGTGVVAVQLKSGATVVQLNGALSTNWGWTSRVDTVDPATNAAWTATGVNNAQIGVASIA